jgi:hypothetical protein
MPALIALRHGARVLHITWRHWLVPHDRGPGASHLHTRCGRLGNGDPEALVVEFAGDDPLLLRRTAEDCVMTC